MTNATQQNHTPHHIAVRTAAELDLPTLVELNVGLSREDAGQRDPFMNPNWPHHARHDYFIDAIKDTDSLVAVADDHVQVVGYLVGRISTTSLRTVSTAILESMYVRQNHRSNSVGTILVQSFLSWARERHAGRVAVTAYVANKGALRFYQRFGLQPRSVTLDMALTGTD